MNLSRAWRTWSSTIEAIAGHLTGLIMSRQDPAAVALSVGDRAPDFTLPGSDGRTYRLADLVGRGPVVLAWFPKAFTAG